MAIHLWMELFLNRHPSTVTLCANRDMNLFSFAIFGLFSHKRTQQTVVGPLGPSTTSQLGINILTSKEIRKGHIFTIVFERCFFRGFFGRKGMRYE